MDEAVDRRSFRLLPSERVLWHGRPRPNTPRDARWTLGPALLVALAVIAALFSGLLYVAGVPAVRSMAFVAFYLLVTAAALGGMPRLLLDPCEYLVTDRHVIWKRGNLRRVLERAGITYARIHWHRSVPGVGHLELVRAVPFGPLARKQRLVLHDVEAPDKVFALIRGAEPNEFAGFCDVHLTDRLDRGERVLWGAGPTGLRLGRAEAITAGVGAAVLLGAVLYAYRTGAVLMALEHAGLPVRSATWMMLFGVILISGSILLSVGAALLWHGLWGARADGSESEYVLTDTRLIIRRGRVELSVDRQRIVDVAELPSTRGSANLHLILDSPSSRALEDSGALSMFSQPRAVVPPVLYEVRDLDLIRQLLLERPSAA